MRPIPIPLSVAELAVLHDASEALHTSKHELLLTSALATADEYAASREGGPPGGPGHVFWSARSAQTSFTAVHIAPSSADQERLERAASRVRMLQGSTNVAVPLAAFVIGATLRMLARRRASDPALARIRLPAQMWSVQRRRRS